METFLYYQYFILLILSLVLINFVLNNLLFKRIDSYKLPPDIERNPPLVSVLVPARNEESNIRRCLNSLLKQDYPLLEILVLDDNSVDRTYQIASKMAQKDKRLRVIKGKKLKSGWLGKSYACHQLAMQAQGSVLLFTDADTLHFKDSVSSALAAMVARDCGGISVFAHQIMVTFHERMMVPFGNLMILCFLPLGLIYSSKNPLFSTAIGQFMMFKKGVYDRMDGHRSVKKEILEDIHISKMVKRAGSRFMIFDGNKELYCRMYKNLREVIRGYTKVLFAAFDYHSINFLVAFVMAIAIFLLPFVFLTMALIFSWPPALLNTLILQVLIIFLIRLIYAIRFKTRSIDILLHPVSMIYLLLIGINSFHRCKFGSRIYWKERTYDVSDEEDLKLVDHPK